MEKYEYFLLALMWGGTILSAIVGKISTPMIQRDRRKNPKEFWRTYASLMIVVIIMTIVTLSY
jgi:TRAP-type C4-dicarboxylate transport system permease small subunit